MKTTTIVTQFPVVYTGGFKIQGNIQIVQISIYKPIAGGVYNPKYNNANKSSHKNIAFKFIPYFKLIVICNK